MDINSLVKILLEIHIFDMEPSRSAKGTEFKNLYTQKSIAINISALFEKYLSHTKNRQKKYLADFGMRNQEKEDPDKDYYIDLEYQSNEF